MTSIAGNERGAALMIVLIVLVGLTALGAAGLTMTASEIRHSENVEASTEVFYAADAGLQRYMGANAVGDHLRWKAVEDTFTVGSSEVIVTPTLVSNLLGREPMYLVRSVATHAEAGVSTTRAVSALGLDVSVAFVATAAIASGTGLHKNGGSGTIDGVDAAPTNAFCPTGAGPDVAGVATPPAGYDQVGGASVPNGTPDIDDAEDGLTLLRKTGIDWEYLTTEDSYKDYDIPPDSWPDFGTLPADEFPVIYMDGDVALNATGNGRGMLIVRGDLELNGSHIWEGLIMVGGAFVSGGSNTVEGSIISGLNLLLGESVGDSDLGNGSKTFQYNSCNVERAMEQLRKNQKLTGLAPVPGSWAEEI